MPWHEFRTNVRHLSALEQERVQQAFELGSKMHEGQKRRSGEPYFNHPIAVAHMLADIGADADTVIAALLHDTVEDTPLTLPELEQQFGKTVHTLVEGVTKLSKADIGEQPNMDEQIETLRKIFTLMEKDVRIMVIKLVDRLHNMQTAEFLSVEKQQNLATETMEVYVKIADRLCMQDLRDELEALCLSILEPQLFAKLSALRNQNEEQGQKVLTNMQRRLEAHFPEHVNDVRMQYEHKSWDNLREQLLTEGTTVTGITGISIVFICDRVETCYGVLGALHQMWQRELLSFQDFINAPAINGYRGVHTTTILEDGTRIRCKIRTDSMNDYARKGITNICFKEDSHDLPVSLPWTQRISPLSEDTQGRSKEFFETLQSDILGESIVIHGPGDQTILIPKGSTALDGALFLFGPDALRLTSIRIGTREVEPDMPLDFAVSLNITIGDQPTVERRWLEKVRTGFAIAMIRSALVQGKTDAEKQPVGKDLLQRALALHGRGFIEEFEEEKMRNRMEQLGYASLKDIYIALADGRLDPSVAYRTLFETPKQKKQNGSTVEGNLTSFAIPRNDMQVLRRLLDVHQKHASQISKVRMWNAPGTTETRFRLHVNATREEQEVLNRDLRNAGGKGIVTRSRSKATWPLLVLVLLWGIDPVLARSLLETVSIADLTVIRFITFFVAAAAVYARQSFLSPQTFKPLSPFQPTLLFSGAALFVTGLFTYLTLRLIPASQYIMFIVAGLAFTALFRQLLRRQNLTRSLLSLVLLAAATGVLMQLQGWDYLGIIGGIGSGMGFALYSVLSKRYLDEVGMIRERYPAYLFWVSGVCLLLSLPLLPFTNLSTLVTENLLASISFSLVFAVLPYLIYFELMRRVESRLLESTLPFVCVSAVIGDALMSKSLVPFATLPLLLVLILLLVLPKRDSRPSA